jgi:hypothetical protein
MSTCPFVGAARHASASSPTPAVRHRKSYAIGRSMFASTTVDAIMSMTLRMVVLAVGMWTHGPRRVLLRTMALEERGLG